MDPYDGRFYDRYFVGVEGDVDFYVARSRESEGEVLELGSGTGRILLPVARAGVEVTGLEPDGELLAVARQKIAESPATIGARVRLVQGDMRDFSLDQRFASVIVPYRTFQHLLTPIDQTEALACIHEHLETDGRLIFNLFDPTRDIAEEGFRGALRKDTDFIDPVSGNQIVVWYSRQYDPEDQIMEQELIYEEIDGEDRVVGRTYGRLILRYATRYEMEYLLDLCGFEVEELYGDFAGGRFPGYGEQVWVARKD